MTKLIVDPILEGARLSNRTRSELRQVWDRNIARGAQEVQLRTAVFEGDLRAGSGLSLHCFVVVKFLAPCQTIRPTVYSGSAVDHPASSPRSFPDHR